jgi:hypothetical protein
MSRKTASRPHCVARRIVHQAVARRRQNCLTASQPFYRFLPFVSFRTSRILSRSLYFRPCSDGPVLLLVLLFLALGACATAQDVPQPAAPAPALVIAKLPPPVYPAMARAARVAGDVNLTISLQADGTINSVHAISGPPMLRDHAEELARQTNFECRNCKTEPTSFPPTIRYSMDAAAASYHDPSYPRVAQLNGVIIIVTDQPVMLSDPAIDSTRVRSFKCLYLWRCGWRADQ